MFLFILKNVYLLFYLAALGLGCDPWDLWGSFIAMHGFSSCDSAPAHGILVPGPGIKPVSPVLQGGLSTTGPPGKFLKMIFLKYLKKIKTLCISRAGG